MTTSNNPTRRTVIRAGVLVAGAAGLSVLLDSGRHARAAAPASNAGAATAQGGRKSANGWLMEPGSDAGLGVWTTSVEGTELSLPLQIGAAQALLLHVVRRYHYEIVELGPGDVVGHRPVVPGLVRSETNHCSGTAVDIRQGHCPVGTGGNLDREGRLVVESLVEECEGVVSWGGHDRRPNEAHFELAVGPESDELGRIAKKLALLKEVPGSRPGVLLR